MSEGTPVARRRRERRAVMTMILPALVLGFLACGDDDEPTGPVNNRPVMQAQRDTSVVLGDTLRLTAHADDLDGDVLDYSFTAFVTVQEILSGYRPDAEMDNSTGQFEFVGQSADQPSRSFRFEADDGRGGVDSTRFSIAVN
jgi:hypothetical protein